MYFDNIYPIQHFFSSRNTLQDIKYRTQSAWGVSGLRDFCSVISIDFEVFNLTTPFVKRENIIESLLLIFQEKALKENLLCC